LGTPLASSCDAVLFMPGFGPGTPFLFAAFGGGASMPFDGAGVDAALESAPLGVAAAGTGVSLAAAATSFLFVSSLLFAGVAAEGVAEASDLTRVDAGGGGGGFSCGNLARDLGESLRMMVFDLEALVLVVDGEVLPADEAAAASLDAGDMAVVWCCDEDDEGEWEKGKGGSVACAETFRGPIEASSSRSVPFVRLSFTRDDQVRSVL
jgi:hypothetical protein